MKNFKSFKIVFLVSAFLFVLVNLNSVFAQPVNINLTNNSEYQYDPSVCISHANPNKVVAAWNDARWGAIRTGYSYSTNGGITWSQTAPLDTTLPGSGYTVGGIPRICVDINGNFYISMVVSNAANLRAVAVYKSTDGGVTFPSASLITNSSVQGSRPGAIACDLTSSSPFSNSLYVTWEDPGNNFFISKSTNGGLNWSTPVTFGIHQYGSSIAISPNGQINLLSFQNSGGFDVYHYCNSTDGGVTFSTDMVIDQGLSVSLLWAAWLPSIACDISGGSRNGYIYCSFSNEGPPNSGEREDVYVIRSTDNGNTWLPQVTVNNDLVQDTYHHEPWIAVNNAGNVAVQYYYSEHAHLSNAVCVTELAISTDGGITFSNQPLSNAQSPRGAAGNLDISIDFWGNTLVPVWNDERVSGNREIFTAIAGLNTVSGLVTYQDNNQPVTHGNVKALFFDNSTGNIITVDSTIIQSDGHYTLGHVPQDSLDIMFYQNDDNLDFVPTYYVSTVDWKQATKIYADHNLTNVNGQVYRINNTTNPYNISGLAFKYPAQGPPNFPLKDAIVYAMIGTDYKNYGISNGSGFYMADNLSSGTYTLMGYRMGYNPVMQIVTIANNNMGNVNFYFGGSPLGIEGTEIPAKFKLYQNYPNPFNPETNIKFDIPKTQNVKIVVYDIMGREVNKPVDRELKPGAYSIKWDGTNFATGIYFYRIETESFIETKKLLLIK